MRKIYTFLSILLFTALSFSLQAQNKFFTAAQETELARTPGLRVIIPQKFQGSTLNVNGLKNFLWSLPSEQSFMNRGQAPVLELPMPDGSSARFRVWESSIMEPGLAAKFPEIRTFAGQGIDDPYAMVRMDYNPYFGFHAQILSVNGSVYIDPYARGNINSYISYYTRDNRRESHFVCEVPDGAPVAAREDAGPCRGTQLYTYRLAVACTGEYAIAVGGTTAPALHAAIVTTVNRVDGVYESELAIRLVLIANNNLIEFLDPTTDPFNGNNNANTLINESQTQITSIIGTANFDIGHTFSTGGGGLAGLGVVCNATNKARGITGSPSPVGDDYDIDYVAHEMGHQFGGSHTFNSITSNCGGGNRSAAQAYEVGSGTTIMAYAGICGSDNIQLHSDPFFHTISFDQISTYVEAGGASCRVATATGNTLPVIVSMDNNNVSIPLNTPFTLTGAATDANGDALTYCWEEWDLGGSGAWNSGATSTTAPLFKSRAPKMVGSRTFPDMAVILAGYPANPTATMGGLKGETLPAVARAMKFRLTVRDNRAAGSGIVTGGEGCQTGFTGTFQINAVATTGPFLVTSPNGGESYPGGSTQTVTWDVAGTSAAPISTSLVKISLSTDGGLTYPTVLLASTANDGSESVSFPSITTTTARVKVEAIANVFFDISNANFTLTTPVSGYDFTSPGPASVACAGPTTASITLGTVSNGGYVVPINLSASGNPAGTTVTFGTNPVVPGNSTVVTLNSTNTLQNGSYTVTITGVSGSGPSAITRTRDITFTIQAGTGPSISLQPQSQAICVGNTATFTVTSATALSYQWQVSSDGGANFSNVGTSSPSYTTAAVTTAMNNYQYRVLVRGQCNTTTSNVATLTIQTPPSVTTPPANTTLCVGTPANFSVTASGTNITYLWQLSTDGGANYSAAPGTNTGSSYTTAAVTAAMNNNRYRVVVSGTCSPSATSAAAILTVISPVVMGTQPTDQTICETGNVTFTTSGTSSQTVIYQWQVSTDGGANYTNMPGETNPTLNVNAVTAAMNNNRYRALLSSSTCTTPTISNVAKLTVNARPTVTLAAAPYTSLLPGQTTTITASILPSATGFNISWFRDNAQLTGVTGTTYTTGVAGIGSYRVDIVNPTTGCNNQSQVLAITATPSEELFIFPSPNNGRFTVSYYNSTGANTRQTIRVFDAHGAVVYSASLPVTGQYTLHDIVMRNAASGIYVVVVGDATGKRLAKAKVLVATRP